MDKPKVVNQTDDSEKNNGGEKDKLALSPQVCSLWLGRRDSNPRSWNQNPLPYHLATPHHLIYFTSKRFELLKSERFDSQIFFC